MLALGKARHAGLLNLAYVMCYPGIVPLHRQRSISSWTYSIVKLSNTDQHLSKGFILKLRNVRNEPIASQGFLLSSFKCEKEVLQRSPSGFFCSSYEFF